MLWRERGGRGQDAYLLLHGLGATGAVWRGVCRELDGRRDAEWLVVDLPGHGRSESLPRYSVGALATAVAATLEPDRSYRLIGHSLGAYVGLALASGWFGVSVASVLGIGPKIDWTEADFAAMAELARKPARIFAGEAEAWARYRKVSGLDERVAADSALLERGVTSTEGGFRLATDPRTAHVAGAPFATLATSARCPVLLVRGESDPMVTLEQLRRHCGAALEIPGTGHNAHVESPASIVALCARLPSEAR
ncbi:MAG TPA: alpha/beta hydrolase [Steroidobacteraceae bacterium]|jgi:pimeloyl-ACP methyl ester carboxylesterase|nr:alpha/beta hydrolase [Steroidobacteraceae bacterium]